MSCQNTHPASRDIEQLHPIFRARVQAWLSEVPYISVHEARRSDARQTCLLKEGKTWVPRSNHQDGLAVDVHFKEAPHFPAASDARWKPVIKAAARHGIESGWTLWGTDTNHFQMKPPFPTEDEKVDYQPLSTEEEQIIQNSAMWHVFRRIEHECAAARTTLHEQNNHLRKRKENTQSENFMKRDE